MYCLVRVYDLYLYNIVTCVYIVAQLRLLFICPDDGNWMVTETLANIILKKWLVTKTNFKMIL